MRAESTLFAGPGSPNPANEPVSVAARRPASWGLVVTHEACRSRCAQDIPCKPASDLNLFFGRPTAQFLCEIGRVKAELFHSVLNFWDIHEYLP